MQPMAFSQHPKFPSLLSRLLLAGAFLAFQLVQSRPQHFISGGELHCPFIQLPQPRPGGGSLPSGLLFESKVEPSILKEQFVMSGSKELCSASGYGVEARDSDVVKAMLTDYGISQGDLKYNASWIESANVFCMEMENHAMIPSVFLFSAAHVRTLCLYKYVVLVVSCRHANSDCYNISIHQVTGDPPQARDRVFRRDASLSLRTRNTNQRSHELEQGHMQDISVGVVVCVIGLVVIVVLLAMCGSGDDKYEPNKVKTNRGKGASNKISIEGEVAEEPQRLDFPTEEATVSLDFRTNGTASASITASANEPSREKEIPKTADSVDRQSASNLSLSPLERGLALSARSFDPLPEVPKLEGGEGENEADGNADDSDDDNDDPYAKVPRNSMSNTDSEEEKDGACLMKKKADDVSSQHPPYGKISRHAKPGESKVDDPDDNDNDSYAEVRDVVRRGPLLLDRERSHTNPVHSSELPPRDKRSLTESAAHMPLPKVPPGRAPPVIAEENEMYDSIPESREKKISQSDLPVIEKTQKERLYESVDEMGERDLYESVPDELVKVDSPSSPVSLTTPSISSPTKAPTTAAAPAPAPLPPPSPIPTKSDNQIKKKTLEKTLSAANAQDDNKKRFSFFGRRKTSSVSSTKPKKGEQLGLPTTLHPNESPQHKSPPLPNIPIPPLPSSDGDDEDTYDKVTPSTAGPDFNEGFQQGYIINKSSSLPMTFRTGGGGGGGGGGGPPNLPLPRVPEDSGTAIVSHKRVLESDVNQDEYDVVHISPALIPDEPNYDVVRPLAGAPPLVVDPPYDKVDKLERVKLREKEAREEQKSVSPQPQAIDPPTPEGEPGKVPDHDEEGYAVVPEEIRIRKRAMSASQGVHQERSELSPESVAAGYHIIRLKDMDAQFRESRSQSTSTSSQKRSGSNRGSNNTSRGSVEDQYASIDLVAKKNRKQELEEVLKDQESLRAYREDPPRSSVSPIPPPLPPAPNLEDMEEYEGPPIPAQSEGIHQLDSEELKLPQGDNTDPPYAKVKSKVDNPYAEVSRPYAEVDVDWIQKQAQTGRVASAVELEDEALGYDVVGTVGVRAKTAQSKQEMMYDTIEDVKSNAGKNPEVETDESAAGENLYDSLLPETPCKEGTPRSMV